MPLVLTVVYPTAADLKGHLAAHAQARAALMPLAQLPAEINQYEPVTLHVAAEDLRCELEASVLQVMDGVGLVVQIKDPSPAEVLVGSVAAPAEPAAPSVAIGQPPDDVPSPRSHPVPAGMGPLSWPIEKLQAEFPTLPTPERIRLARYGKRPARALILRSQDKNLHSFLLGNNGISAEEVAALASMTSADPAMLKRIAASPEWLRHTSVVRSLICNPKLTIPQVIKLIKHLREDDLRRLAKTGRVRAAVKREIIRYIERGR